MIELEVMIKQALECVYQDDSYLIFNNDRDHCGERAIVARFMIYFHALLNASEYKHYNLDCEYNQNMGNPKSLPSFENGTYPDIILHKRGSNDHNILIMEFKTWWNSNQNEDIRKIKEFMAPKGQYKYKYGCTILLEKDKYEIDWIIGRKNIK